MPKSKSFRLELIKKERVTEHVVSFYFSTQEEIEFTPGQYLQLILPHANPDDRGTSRFFSIASSPTEKQLMLAIKKGKSSFKQRLFTLEIGATISSFGPLGKFILDGEMGD